MGISTKIKPLGAVKSEVLQEEYHHAKTSSGLDMYVMPKSGYNEKYAMFATRYGAIDTDFMLDDKSGAASTPPGVAHFLEHKLFENPKGNVFDEFAGLGASVNAYTGYTLTSYLFSTTDNFLQCLALLLDFVMTPYFTPESVEKERGIIAQEITMFEDEPGHRVFTNLMNAVYHVNNVREKIAGTTASIGRITPEVLYACHQAFYHPKNMVLFVVGEVEPGEVFQLAEKQLGKTAAQKAEENSSPVVRRIHKAEPFSVKAQSVEMAMAVARPLCYLGFKDNCLQNGNELLKRQLIGSLALQILFGKTSALYSYLYENGLIDLGFGVHYTAERNFAHAVVGGSTDDPEKFAASILKGLQKAREKGIEREEFTKQKRKSIGGFLYAFNALDFIASNFISIHFKGSSLFSYLDMMQEITLDDVEGYLHSQLIEDNLAISTVIPM
ncbi:MAG: insulinase family protein [Firmicutes bacterium]|nr:insulinase family protein [Bacillota bacterium]